MSYPSLAGKTVFVSGGGSGIGAAIVSRFAEQGCRVAFCDIDDESSQELVARLAPAPVRYHHCDLRDIAALRATLAAVAAEFGPIDVLINNAARDDRHKIEDVTPEYWDERFAVNLRHHFFAIQAVVPGMTALGGGVDHQHGLGVVDACDARDGRVHGGKSGDQWSHAHAGARAGAAEHSRQLRRPRRDLTERQRKLWFDPEAEQAIIDSQCLKFRLQEDDVARPVVFLASDEARGMTGHNLIVDAGLAQTSAD